MTESFDIWSAAFPSEPLPVCSNDPPVVNSGPTPGGGGSQVRTYEGRRKTSKILLSETGRLRALVFGM